MDLCILELLKLWTDKRERGVQLEINELDSDETDSEYESEDNEETESEAFKSYNNVHNALGSEIAVH